MNVAAILKLKGRDVITTPPDTALLDIAKLLDAESIGCIVVAQEDGKVVGIVSERDIVRALAREGVKVLKEPVESCMTKAVVSCREADTIDRLMSEMTAHRFRHMPVVEKGRLIGLVSIGDVVKMRIGEAEMEAAAMRSYIGTG
jgi:CBS domain-containing protein